MKHISKNDELRKRPELIHRTKTQTEIPGFEEFENSHSDGNGKNNQSQLRILSTEPDISITENDQIRELWARLMSNLFLTSYEYFWFLPPKERL